jgi:hypothetical protein
LEFYSKLHRNARKGIKSESRFFSDFMKDHSFCLEENILGNGSKGQGEGTRETQGQQFIKQRPLLKMSKYKFPLMGLYVISMKPISSIIN